MRRVLPILCAVLLAGCPPPRDWCAEAAEYDPTLELGGGETAYAPFTEGQQVETAWGGQGGQHIWTGVRTTGVVPGTERPKGPEAPEIEYELYGNGTDKIGYGVRFWPLDGDLDEATSFGDTLILDWWETPYDSYEIEARLVDTCGTRLTTRMGITMPADFQP